MLITFYILLRFRYFSGVMLLFGSAIYSFILAPFGLRRVLVDCLQTQWKWAIWSVFTSSILLFMVQGGLMGNGWHDVINPAIWRVVLDTQFGSIWIWQLLLAFITVIGVLIFPYRFYRIIQVTTALQLIVLSGIGHGAMHDGMTGILQRINQSIHLMSAALWVGSLPALMICIPMVNRPHWRLVATTAMVRFSQSGHFAVVAVLLTGMFNSLLIMGWPLPFNSDYFRLLMVKFILVSVMVSVALVNRYILVPRLTDVPGKVQKWFMFLTRLEIILAMMVLLLVSIYGTLEPF